MLFIYSVKDEKTGAFMKPFSALHNEAVIRSLRSSISQKNPGDSIAEFPEDFSLWCLGEFDQDTGDISSFKSHILNLVDLANLNKGPSNVA